MCHKYWSLSQMSLVSQASPLRRSLLVVWDYELIYVPRGREEEASVDLK